jgi:hypothetical protein
VEESAGHAAEKDGAERAVAARACDEQVDVLAFGLEHLLGRAIEKRPAVSTLPGASAIAAS